MSFRTVYNLTYSEAGWRMCNRDECDLVRIPGLEYTNTAPLRKGAPLTILGAWMYWYDRNVEEITSPVWGWSATNAVASSNHLSGTAIDVNAPKYPWGSSAVNHMSPNKISKIREGLRLFEGSVFWGQDWGRRDPMHYQCGWRENNGRNGEFAAKLRSGYLGIYSGGSTPPPPSAPSVGIYAQRGSVGANVSRLQQFMNRAFRAYSRLAVDGDFGPATEAVVREFQKRVGIERDGIVGPITLRNLQRYGFKP